MFKLTKSLLAGLLHPAFASGGACPPPLRSRPAVFGPQVTFITVVGQAVGGWQPDILVQLPFPIAVIQVASVLTPQNSIFFHFAPLGRVNTAGSAAIVPTGKEQWLPMTSQPVASGAPFYWTYLRFGTPIKFFYLDLGAENGAAQVVTFMCSSDPDAVVATGGPWT